jgi:hypothetical protein
VEELGLENSPNFFFNSYLYVINVNFTIMPRYKISKSNLKEFFGFFGKPKKPKNIDDIIKNDPVLQKLDKEIGDLNKKASDRLKNDEEAMRILKKLGIEVT